MFVLSEKLVFRFTTPLLRRGRNLVVLLTMENALKQEPLFKLD